MLSEIFNLYVVLYNLRYNIFCTFVSFVHLLQNVCAQVRGSPGPRTMNVSMFVRIFVVFLKLNSIVCRDWWICGSVIVL